MASAAARTGEKIDVMTGETGETTAGTVADRTVATVRGAYAVPGFRALEASGVPAEPNDTPRAAQFLSKETALSCPANWSATGVRSPRSNGTLLSWQLGSAASVEVREHGLGPI